MTVENRHKGLYRIIGPPGTGKTYRIAQSVARVCREYADNDDGDRRSLPAAVCSLTRAAATEASGRVRQLPPEAVGTLHSFAYRALDRPTLADSMAADFNAEYPDMAITGTNPNSDETPFGEGAAQGGDRLAMEYHRRRAAKLPMAGALPKVQRFAIAWEDFKERTDSIDFTDMIEHARSCLSCPGQPGVLFADEAQDHSRLELDLLLHWGHSADAMILVGDPYQSLYEWRGASPSIFFDGDVPADHQDVLAQSYRVPQAVHSAATRWIRTNFHGYQPVEYRPRDAKHGRSATGSVVACQGTWNQSPEAIVQRAIECRNRDMSVMIAASCGYMLDPIVMRLREHGVPFANPWRRTNGRWNPLGTRAGTTMPMRLLAFLKPLTGKGMHEEEKTDADFDFGANVHAPDSVWTFAELAAFVEVIDAKPHLVSGAKSYLKNMRDQSPDQHIDPVLLAQIFKPEHLAFLNRLVTSGVTVEDASSWLFGKMLKAKTRTMGFACKVARHGIDALQAAPKLFVGTIHSFKGAEADAVILLPDVSPEACREWLRPETHNRVVRMFYVGMTRAREELHVCNPSGSFAVPLWTRN